MTAAGREARETDALGAALRACRTHLGAVGAFSAVANLLQLTVSLYMMQVFDRVLTSRNLDTLLHLTLIALFALLVFGALEGARGVLMQRLSAWLEAQVGPHAFAKGVEAALLGRPYRMDALRDLSALRGFLGGPGALALFDLPWIPVFLALVFVLHPLLGLVALAGAALLLAAALLGEALAARPAARAGAAQQVQARRAEAMARNAEAIEAMGMGQAASRRWEAGQAAALPALSAAGDVAAVVIALTRFLRFAVQVALLGLGAWLVLGQAITPGASLAASIIMGRALAPVEQLAGAWRQISAARQARARLRAFLTEPALRPAAVAPPAPRGLLGVERVIWAPAGASVPVLKGVSFAVAPGEILTVVGPSAAGKTSLLRCLVGVHRPQAGQVRLDGAEVFAWPRESFGRHVGYLPQDVELFEGTVFDNIARLGAAEPEQVFAAARLAGCNEMILRLPRGYDTEVGEGGQHLSGGQRQMIGLARAMFGRPRLLVLDEPNANLDGEGEARLLGALQQAREEGAAIVLVSHRPAALHAADRLLLLRDGAVEAFGPRAEVLKRLMAARAALPQTAPLAQGG